MTTGRINQVTAVHAAGRGPGLASATGRRTPLRPDGPSLDPHADTDATRIANPHRRGTTLGRETRAETLRPRDARDLSTSARRRPAPRRRTNCCPARRETTQPLLSLYFCRQAATAAAAARGPAPTTARPRRPTTLKLRRHAPGRGAETPGTCDTPAPPPADTRLSREMLPKQPSPS